MKPKLRLKNKVVVITGGAGLIGGAFVNAAIENGANVAVLDMTEETFAKKVLFLKCDITNEKSVSESFQKIVQKFGKIDVLVNSAYPKNKNYGRKMEDVTYDDFCENVGMHLGGYFLTSKEVAKIMKKQRSGNIINVASIYGFSAPRFDIYKGVNMAMGTTVEYVAVKGAIINLTKYLASYLGEYNIRVNSLSPGGVFNNQPQKFIKNYSKKVLLGNRMARPSDLVGAFLFLSSDDSGYITGHNLVIDGGWTI
ncbi:MAG: flagellin modification protein A [Candidatus Yanofskybacteria bacterium CG10_big_fil_rev_8_21_14_0_10_36_16]|uniref:Flagellin modification protein A n=1 Tax=Candidatus Yanofskybacteria bacterium CG10_big_fil_rev_8_21_14_0_10_36_16 TaxID=1975096 RepID=A0A2J0Q7J7_9BACT|nr:MAG: flagellin modification protein A [Candidatus Yanofskybacteria bacterium CG10_big_fil_rev_8_21_14_0_10_36_16]